MAGQFLVTPFFPHLRRETIESMHKAFVLLGLIAPLYGQPSLPSDAAYYPLHLGGSWTYRVEKMDGSNPRISKVTWNVRAEDKRQSPPVFQLWPKPMQVDDEAMQLRILTSGIEDVASKMFVLKFPLKANLAWSDKILGSDTQVASRVLTVGSPCRASNVQFAKCAVVETANGRAGLRTVTTYARGKGPVIYEHYRRRSGNDVLVQRLELEESRSKVDSGR
jgi:hypothetical protein